MYRYLLSIVLLISMTCNTWAVFKGVDDADNQETNAVVYVGGCTGSLITPDLVLTAQHCIGNVPRIYQELFSARNSGPLGFGRGNLFAYVGTFGSGEIYAKTVEAPFWNRSNIARTDVDKFSSITRAADHPDIAIAAISDNKLVRINVITGAQSEPVEVPVTVLGLATLDDQIYLSAADGTLLRADSIRSDWEKIGQPGPFITLTSTQGRLYGITPEQQLFVGDPDQDQWVVAGKAPSEITAMMASGSLLVAQSKNGRFWTRSALPWEEEWEQIGGGLPGLSSPFTAIALLGDRFFGADDTGRHIHSRVSFRFRSLGTAPNFVSLTASDDYLYGLASNDMIFRRQLTYDNTGWQSWGDGGGVKKIAALPFEKLLGVGDGKFSTRSVSSSDGDWEETRDVWQPAVSGAMDALPNGQIFIMDPAANVFWVRKPGFAADADYLPIHPRGISTGIAVTNRQFYGFFPGSGIWRRPRNSPADFWVHLQDPLATPGRWQEYASTPGGAGPTIGIGLSETPFDEAIKAKRFMIVGNDDIVIMELTESVDSAFAKPISVMTTNPIRNPSDWTNTNLKMVGWGLISPCSAFLTPTQIRQTKPLTGPHQWPTQQAVGHVSAHWVRATVAGEISQCGGDSGGPLLWRPNASSSWRVIGTLQATDGSYVATFGDGRLDSYGYPHAAINKWIDAVLGSNSFFQRFFEGR